MQFIVRKLFEIIKAQIYLVRVKIGSVVKIGSDTTSAKSVKLYNHFRTLFHRVGLFA